ncbi:MAG TPA: hypothetical protein VME63_04105 [Dyella sp.]|uniref:hypothetical protein n=1 Tax=Dyella sp. TaxID=1869338 RepID=UPI002B5B90F2|nr:hypothetical protein [Dyella sp.]HTV84561.1 hypothetical protein [Dyella sp.]
MAKWLIATWFFPYPQELWISLWMRRGEHALLPINTPLSTRCSSFDQLKLIMFINVLRNCFDSVAAVPAHLTPAYVNPLTLCKTELSAPEK